MCSGLNQDYIRKENFGGRLFLFLNILFKKAEHSSPEFQTICINTTGDKPARITACTDCRGGTPLSFEFSHDYLSQIRLSFRGLDSERWKSTIAGESAAAIGEPSSPKGFDQNQLGRLMYLRNDIWQSFILGCEKNNRKAILVNFLWLIEDKKCLVFFLQEKQKNNKKGSFESRMKLLNINYRQCLRYFTEYILHE